MTTGPLSTPTAPGSVPRRVGWLRPLAFFAALLLGIGWIAYGQLRAPSLPAADVSPNTAALARAEARPFWRELTARQQTELDTLKATWPTIEGPQKQKWLEVSARMSQLSADEQNRIKLRMSDWVAMTPRERGQARIQFQEAQRVAPGGRQEQWEAYQALPPEERRALAAQALAAAKKAAAPATAPAKGSTAHPSSSLSSASVRTGPETKRNIASAPLSAPSPKQVGPTVVQSRQGATTSLITTLAKPPAHHQAGLPKVNAGPGFVDPATLLPLRGPQGAAALVPAKSTELPVVDD